MNNQLLRALFSRQTHNSHGHRRLQCRHKCSSSAHKVLKFDHWPRMQPLIVTWRQFPLSFGFIVRRIAVNIALVIVQMFGNQRGRDDHVRIWNAPRKKAPQALQLQPKRLHTTRIFHPLLFSRCWHDAQGRPCRRFVFFQRAFEVVGGVAGN